MTTDPSATLAGIRERAGVFVKLGPPRPVASAVANAAYASAADIPSLLAAIEAVLELADTWKTFAASGDAQDECADELRAAIAATLAGKGADRG